MPTPHGSRGGMAFSADEVRVLRRALAQALHPAVPAQLTLGTHGADLWAEDVQEALRLAEAIDEAAQEGGRLRSFLLDELSRYRSALPGSARGYLERLEEAVTDGYLPGPDDLSALRSLSRLPCGPGERSRRSRLAGRCHALAEAAVRVRLALSTGFPHPSPAPALAPRHLAAVPSPTPAPAPGHLSALAAVPPSSPTDRAGGPIPMSSPTEPRSTDAAATAAASEPGHRAPRVPTPSELFARRPKPSAHPPVHTAVRTPVRTPLREGDELATGTG
ncbi:hypothetical protein P3T37_006720 [Kitasatospora sp. MAA4]|uniref:hypothetical protein n=1 Tax=Kitasatospora sp. MAA4 TaxID=3035093 RepID=UPI00247701F0|nr:hypothetical protein [Kitasatospora sp. MAA4]MDH6137288.1 hypothetical protein [Kitasatospora sp. MAA4]